MFKKRAPILNLTLPSDPLEQVMYLDTVQAQVDLELDAAYQKAYFDVRVTGRLDAALRLGRASKKKALRWTRHQNEATGRQVRWNDGH